MSKQNKTNKATQNTEDAQQEPVLEELQVTKGRYRGAVPSFCMVPPSPYRRRHRCTL